MIVTIYFEVDHKKTGFGPKNSIFGPQKGHFGQLGPQNGLPSGQTTTYQKTKVIQSYLRIWWTYDLIESELSDPKKGGLYGCSVKKTDFANIVKFGHFWGGIAAKICICAKKCSTYGMLWVRTSKKNLCQPSDPWAF